MQVEATYTAEIYAPPMLCEESDCVPKASDLQTRRTFRLAVVSVLIAASGLGYQIYRDSHPKASTEARFAKIETALRLLTGAVAPQLQKAVDDSLAAALQKPSEAKEQLKYSSQIIRQLRDSNIHLPTAAIANTSASLSNVVSSTPDAELPQTWATVADFISYRSSMFFSGDVTALSQSELPDCTENLPTHMQVQKVIDDSHMITTRAEYSNCRITLDSKGDAVRLNYALKNGYALITFKHCLVVYRGGNVAINFGWTKLENVQYAFSDTDSGPQKVGPGTVTIEGNAIEFDNCLFDFYMDNVPPSNGKMVSRHLLAQNSPVLSLPTT